MKVAKLARAVAAAATATTTAAHPSAKLVGGVDAAIEQFPYQISLQYYFPYPSSDGFYGYRFPSHVCGGVIIRPDSVLTAAHCIIDDDDDKWDRDNFLVRAGSSSWSSGGQLVKVAGITTHPSYDPKKRFANDVAVLRLAHNLTLGATVAVADLPGPRDEAPSAGADVVVAGWGHAYSMSMKSTTRLRSLASRVVSWKECAIRYARSGGIGRDNLCAGDMEGLKNARQGDSGGGLYHVARKKVVGIVSYGTLVPRRGYPTVFTDVSRLGGWIKKVSGA
ncbi:trypsin delta/gamma [Metarhizium album ARSEF 1941]|uniref:trypsin n=1 Tax=Metarhizium album (strain ARSEF 1941) TaxID=1081103 RepID=A0A0B2WXI2_METAS|nr:trypsin delta/gamma [Metarhizium album ARSEF 1941]KHN98264.1 trypsin delta/gamma [Metarhizium album ARSEF 1941]